MSVALAILGLWVLTSIVVAAIWAAHRKPYRKGEPW